MSIQQASKCYVRWDVLVVGTGDMRGLLTEYERKHVRQRSRCIVYYMELACLKEREPDTSAFAEDSGNTSPKCYQGCSIQ
jgi:hypothetical protein